MTREQVETEMAQYRTIFTVVRLLDAAQVGGEESVNSFCSCYSYWGKNTPCRNCISRQVLEDHRQRTKLEARSFRSPPSTARSTAFPVSWS